MPADGWSLQDDVDRVAAEEDRDRRSLLNRLVRRTDDHGPATDPSMATPPHASGTASAFNERIAAWEEARVQRLRAARERQAAEHRQQDQINCIFAPDLTSSGSQRHHGGDYSGKLTDTNDATSRSDGDRLSEFVAKQQRWAAGRDLRLSQARAARAAEEHRDDGSGRASRVIPESCRLEERAKRMAEAPESGRVRHTGGPPEPTFAPALSPRSRAPTAALPPFRERCSGQLPARRPRHGGGGGCDADGNGPPTGRRLSAAAEQELVSRLLAPIATAIGAASDRDPGGSGGGGLSPPFLERQRRRAETFRVRVKHGSRERTVAAKSEAAARETFYDGAPFTPRIEPYIRDRDAIGQLISVPSRYTSESPQRRQLPANGGDEGGATQKQTATRSRPRYASASPVIALPFLQRQRYFSRRWQESLTKATERRRQASADETAAACTFRPALSPRSREIAAAAAAAEGNDDTPHANAVGDTPQPTGATPSARLLFSSTIAHVSPSPSRRHTDPLSYTDIRALRLVSPCLKRPQQRGGSSSGGAADGSAAAVSAAGPSPRPTGTPHVHAKVKHSAAKEREEEEEQRQQVLLALSRWWADLVDAHLLGEGPPFSDTDSSSSRAAAAVAVVSFPQPREALGSTGKAQAAGDLSRYLDLTGGSPLPPPSAPVDAVEWGEGEDSAVSEDWRHSSGQWLRAVALDVFSPFEIPLPLASVADALAGLCADTAKHGLALERVCAGGGAGSDKPRLQRSTVSFHGDQYGDCYRLWLTAEGGRVWVTAFDGELGVVVDFSEFIRLHEWLSSLVT